MGSNLSIEASPDTWKLDQIRYETMTAAKYRLIIALDFPDADEARALVRRVSNAASVYKVGHELIFGGDGLDLVRELADAGKQVFLDAKLLDIGNTVERSTSKIADLGATLLTVHGHDRKTMSAAVAGRGDSSLKLLAVTVMTNLTQDDLSEQGIEMTSEQLVVHRAKLAAACGFDGVIASAQEATPIRDAVGGNFLIVTPGIRPRGSDVGDQARVMTPAGAITAGATHLVIGRPVTRAEDPKAATEAIIAEIDEALSAI